MHEAILRRRLPALVRPTRNPAAPRNGTQSGPMAQQVSDAFYRCAVEVAKVVYTRIDARYPYKDRKDNTNDHSTRMSEAKKILNEHRNEVLETVLPLFIITLRSHTNSELATEADEHAHGYIVDNLFDTMVRTFQAWADEFVEAKDVDALNAVVTNVAAIQRERLSALLAGYKFAFRSLAVK